MLNIYLLDKKPEHGMSFDHNKMIIFTN